MIKALIVLFVISTLMFHIADDGSNYIIHYKMINIFGFLTWAITSFTMIIDEKLGDLR